MPKKLKNLENVAPEDREEAARDRATEESEPETAGERELRLRAEKQNNAQEEAEEKSFDFSNVGIKNAAISVTRCGHINKQSFNAKNELEDVACTREKGHAGDHTAELNGKEVAWSDAAGKPARNA